jgi:hypothetical protein
MTIKLTDRFLTSRKPPTAGRARAGTHPEGKARQGGVRVNREVQRQRRLDLYPKSPMLTSTASGVCGHGLPSRVLTSYRPRNARRRNAEQRFGIMWQRVRLSMMRSEGDERCGHHPI